jgi:predicted AAA+ superfamily ATPase
MIRSESDRCLRYESMNELIADFVYSLQRQSQSLLLYQNVLSKSPGQAYLKLLVILAQALAQGIDAPPGETRELPNQLLQAQANAEIPRQDRHYRQLVLDCLRAYGDWFSALAATGQSWTDYLLSQILSDRNAFSLQAQTLDFEHLPPDLITAAEHDLNALRSIFSCDGDRLSQWVRMAVHLSQLPVLSSSFSNCPGEHGFNANNSGDRTVSAVNLARAELKTKFQQTDNWSSLINPLANYYRQFGTGIFANYLAFRWYGGNLVGIPHPDPIQASSLVGYEYQKELLLQNTEAFLAGYPALNALLYGSRGSGKSSLVKSLLNLYGDRGLRLIDLAQSDLQDLPLITEQLWQVPQKFIIFVDDLSFEEDESNYKALKAILEGSLVAKPPNAIVYATSNRRHLIREFFSDRPRPSDADEIHAWDTVQEKISLSDRFGLTLTFTAANQDTYLEIVHHLAKLARINLPTEDLEFRALQWATNHSGRSGRTARQFIDFLYAELQRSG